MISPGRRRVSSSNSECHSGRLRSEARICPPTSPQGPLGGCQHVCVWCREPGLTLTSPPPPTSSRFRRDQAEPPLLSPKGWRTFPRVVGGVPGTVCWCTAHILPRFPFPTGVKFTLYAFTDRRPAQTSPLSRCLPYVREVIAITSFDGPMPGAGRSPWWHLRYPFGARPATTRLPALTSLQNSEGTHPAALRSLVFTPGRAVLIATQHILYRVSQGFRFSDVTPAPSFPRWPLFLSHPLRPSCPLPLLAAGSAQWRSVTFVSAIGRRLGLPLPRVFGSGNFGTYNATYLAGAI